MFGCQGIGYRFDAVMLATPNAIHVASGTTRRMATPSWFTPFKETIPLDRADPLALQIEHFAAVMRGEATPLVSGRDGLQNLRVIDAIAEAARTGNAVDVDIAR